MQNESFLKKTAAEKAVELIHNGDIVGLGSGSTFEFALIRISEKMKMGQLSKVIGIPSSVRTAQHAQRLGVPLSSLDENPLLDITIDGADEIDSHLNLIKGGGGALLREKILEQCSKRVVIVVDESKVSTVLGEKWGVPVEVLPFAWRTEQEYLESLGAKVTMRKHKDGTIYKTDQDNLILDSVFGLIDNPGALAEKLNQRAGIMEHGLFIGLASEAIIAGADGVRHIKAGG